MVRTGERGGLGRGLGAGAALAICAFGGWYAGGDAWVFLAAVGVVGWAGQDHGGGGESTRLNSSHRVIA